MNVAQTLPVLIRPWPTWGKANGMSRGQAYSAFNKLPKDLKVQIGGRLFLNAQRLAAYLEAGGDLSAQTA